MNVSRHVTFICGRAGVCALGAVVAKHAGDEKLLKYYITQFKEVLSGFFIFPILMTLFPLNLNFI